MACCVFPISSSTWAICGASPNGSAKFRARSAGTAEAYAHVGTLSNLKEDGKFVGLPDAGQDWHTDMSYRDVMGFVNVLYGIRIPRRDGKPLGGTEFSNMHAAYEALPADDQDAARRMRPPRTTSKNSGSTCGSDKASDAPADDRRTTAAAAAGGASAVPDASDHRAEGAVLQSRLHDADQRTAGARKRRDARVSIRLPA